jgi:hypothetical protein
LAELLAVDDLVVDSAAVEVLAEAADFPAAEQVEDGNEIKY